jgi:ankyrin repeat protein
MIALLLAAGADPELRLASKVLRLVVRSGWTEVLAALLRAGVSANERNELDETPLEIAAKFGKVECVEALVAGGAAVDAVGSKGRTALIHVLESGLSGSCSVACALLEAGASPNTRDEEGNTPLHWAVTRGLVQVATKLLACSSIDVSTVDARGRTALHRAAELGRVEFVAMLVIAGVPLGAVDVDGRTALDLASRDTVTVLLMAGRKAYETVAEAATEQRVALGMSDVPR